MGNEYHVGKYHVIPRPTSTDRSLPALPMCGTCSDPGHCCRELSLLGESAPSSFWRVEGTALHALVRAAYHELPLLPYRQSGPYREGPDGAEYVAWSFSCHELRPNGRCGIYEHRPQMCRDFEPGSSPLCVYHTGSGA